MEDYESIDIITNRLGSNELLGFRSPHSATVRGARAIKYEDLRIDAG